MGSVGCGQRLLTYRDNRLAYNATRKIEGRNMIFRGKELLIDDEDLHLLDEHRWWWSDRNYLLTKVGFRQTRRTLSLHRMIMGDPEGAVIDHINRMPHDNRRSNLRITSYSANNRNSVKLKKDPSLPNGVTRYKDGRYQVVLRGGDKKLKWLGLYDTPHAAGQAADEFLSALSP